MYHWRSKQSMDRRPHHQVLFRQYGNGYGSRGTAGSMAREGAAFRRRLAARREKGARILVMFMVAFVSSILILKRQYNSFQSATSTIDATSLAKRLVGVSSPQNNPQEASTNQNDSIVKSGIKDNPPLGNALPSSLEEKNTSKSEGTDYQMWAPMPFPNVTSNDLDSILEHSVSLSLPSLSDLWNDIVQNGFPVNIPTNIWFTYKHNIFEVQEPRHFYDNVQHTVKEYTKAFQRHLRTSNEEVRVTCMDNNYCRRLIEIVYPDLLPYFDAEWEGCYKGDICRLVALYLYGGYYFDVDIEVIRPLILPSRNNHTKNDQDSSFYFLRNATFVTSIDLNQVGLFQAFIVAPPRHPLVKANLDTIYLYYKHNRIKGYTMGPMTMVDAYRSMVGSSFVTLRRLHNGKWEHQRPADLRKGQPSFDNYLRDVGHYVPLLPESAREPFDNSIVLLQEIHFRQGLKNDLEPRKRPKGDEYTRRCNVIVEHPETQTVYFWARVVGSDNCPFVE